MFIPRLCPPSNQFLNIGFVLAQVAFIEDTREQYADMREEFYAGLEDRRYLGLEQARAKKLQVSPERNPRALTSARALMDWRSDGIEQA